MTIDQLLLSNLFQSMDARTVERQHLNEFLDTDRPAQTFNII
jgi:hypothetical protein